LCRYDELAKLLSFSKRKTFNRIDFDQKKEEEGLEIEEGVV